MLIISLQRLVHIHFLRIVWAFPVGHAIVEGPLEMHELPASLPLPLHFLRRRHSPLRLEIFEGFVEGRRYDWSHQLGAPRRRHGRSGRRSNLWEQWGSSLGGGMVLLLGGFDFYGLLRGEGLVLVLNVRVPGSLEGRYG